MKKPRAMTIRIPGPYAQQLREMWKELRALGENSSDSPAAEVLSDIYNLTLRWEDRIRELKSAATPLTLSQQRTSPLTKRYR